MSISLALENNSSGSSNRIQGSGFIHGLSSRVSILESPVPGQKTVPAPGTQDRGFTAAGREQEASSCSPSSSIGRNSDCSSSSRSDSEEESEVQSSYKGPGPLDTMDSLEDSLPISISLRRGISKFYRGKSKSFTSLADVVASSAEDLGKPDNPYNRKRKNLLACSGIRDRNHNHSLRNRSSGSIPKRPSNSNRSTFSVALIVSGPESNTSEEHESRLPPLPPHGKSSLNTPIPQCSFSSRSFSLADLQEAGTTSSIIQCDRLKWFH
ncbi:hypothetical protein AAC387_Pa02g5189 [Persea americana]